MAWTKEQQAAIEERGKNILVAAAAGSGKTAVLVERIIQKVLAKEMDIDQILVVTFTNAAAEEMRQRIAASLTEKAQENPEDISLARQLILLNNASISTIHSFCQNVIRRNFASINLDPKFRLGIEQEIELIVQDVMDDIFEIEYEKNNEVFLQFIDEYGSEKGDDKVHQLIWRLFKNAQSQPFPKHWLNMISKKFSEEAVDDLENSEWLKIIKETALNELYEAKDLIEYQKKCALSRGGEIYLSTYEQDNEVVDYLLNTIRNKKWDDIVSAFKTEARKSLFSSFPRKGFSGTEEDKKYLSNLRKEMKDSVTKIGKKFFASELTTLKEDMTSVEPAMTYICHLTKRFMDSFSEAKLSKGILDFNDLEHYAFRVLREEREDGVVVPSAVAVAIQEKYAEIMIDEFQDINPLQDAILSLVRRDKNPSSFIVGDIKQSIYGFRMADAEIFSTKQENYPKLGERYRAIVFGKNFRSRGEVLAGINYIFRQIMQKEPMEIEYGDMAALYPGADYPVIEKTGQSVEIELDLIELQREKDEEVLDNGLTDFRAQARHIANRIKNMVLKDNGEPSGVLIYDKKINDYRQIIWSDIVVLMRAISTKGAEILEEMRAQSIPAYTTEDAGYFKEIEIRVIISVLSIIDNARQDIPLAAVLHSPIGDFSTLELSELRLNSSDEDLFTALINVNNPEKNVPPNLRQKASEFLLKLAKWRDLAKHVSVSELIWQIYLDTGYYEYVGSMINGKARQANLRMLIDKAEEYEKTDFRGLFRFLRFIEKIDKRNSDFPVASIFGENENVVRIMSIHKSKGLEFPVVFLANVEKEFNQQDTKDTLLIDKKLGLGPYVILNGNYRFESIARLAVAEKIKKALKAEEMRVLYVALTRAKEKLIMVGHVRNIKNMCDKWCRHIEKKDIALPSYTLSKAKSYLDWIAMAFARHKDAEEIRKNLAVGNEFSALEIEQDSTLKINIIPVSSIQSHERIETEDEKILSLIKEKKKLPATIASGKVNEILTWEYDYKGLKEIPSKLSVSELKKRFTENLDRNVEIISKEKQEISFQKPNFLSESDTLTSMQYGTLMHLILENIDYSREISIECVEDELNRMVKKEIISEKEKNSVTKKSIIDFFTSTIGKRMRMAKKVYRELPFSRMISANRFYPEIQDEKAQIFSQGIIDLLFEEDDDSLVLVDYKTDKTMDENILKKRYELQIHLYQEAIEKITGKKVKEGYLFLLRTGKEIQIL